MDYSRHARGDSLFYEQGDRTQHPGDAYLLDVPRGWQYRQDADWTHLIAPVELPIQGWKVHVSSTPAQARHVLSVAAEVCVGRGTAFKHLSSRSVLEEQNSKYADRGRSGKFITVYPASEAEFLVLLDELADRLDGLSAPYILSDARWREGPVYFRWGAFAAMETVTEDGDRVPAVLAPDGTSVIDERAAAFRLPAFVEAPAKVRATVRERLEPTDGGRADLLAGRSVERVLHASNGGGVYLLRDGSGDRVVMKEGRPHVALDGRGRTARERVEHEFAVLQRLRSSEAVVTPIALRRSGDHAFLLEEYVDGPSLFEWVAAHYPYSYVDDVAGYQRQAVDLLDRLEVAVRAVHSRGVALLDLQPRNVVVDRDGDVRLIDLETACDTSEHDVASIGTPGYVPPWPADPVQRDHYGLAQTAMHVFQPLTPLNDLCDGLWASALAAVARDFGASTAARLARLREAAVPHPRPADQDRLAPLVDTGLQDQRGKRDLALALREGCRTSRRRDDDRPYPGDPRQFERLGAWDVENGLAGVMHVLGPSDVRARDDLRALQHAARRTAHTQGGLLRGLLGIAVVLAARGALPAAEEATARELATVPDPDDVSLRTGIAGRVLALRALRGHLPTAAVDRAHARAVDSLRAVLLEPPPRLHSPGRSTDEPVGLLDGWAGAALAAISLGRDTGDESWFAHAAAALARDMTRLEEARDGSLQVRDGSRLMPYLADGSAGIGVVLSQLPRRTATHDDALVRIARACRVRCCANVGLMHGRAGLLAALAVSPVQQLDGVPLTEVVSEQVRLLPVHLFRRDGRRDGRGGVVAAGENCLRLSADLGTGSAGVAAVLDLLAGDPGELFPGVPLLTPARRGAGDRLVEERG